MYNTLLICSNECVRQKNQDQIDERALSRWRLVEDFRKRLKTAAANKGLAATWSNPNRLLQQDDYLSLFLFGLVNPVVQTMRGLCAASRLKRVQEEVCGRPVSLGSFSEAQHLLDPELLREVFASMSREMAAQGRVTGPGGRRWLIQDGSLFAALPRMHWALWRRQGRAQAQVRLHLSLDMEQGSPARAGIAPGKTCERKAWRAVWQRGDGFVGDRYYGEDYGLLNELDEEGLAYVVRLRDEAVLEAEEELPLSQEDREAKVIRSAWVRLGSRSRRRDGRVRVVWIQTPKEILRLVTNLGPDELSAADVALLYKHRWEVELFFRWLKCILGCRHWLAESPEGAAIELYLALIAALLLQLYTGVRPNRRLMEMIRWYLMGQATLDELEQAIEKAKSSKKS